MPAASGGGGGALAAAGSPSTKVIDAHLAVQATIRSYQVRKKRNFGYSIKSILCILTNLISPRQVRGHLAAQVDPLNLNNMNREEAKKLIIRSVNIQEGDMDTVYQLPATTWIGGKVGRHRISCTRNLDCSLGLSLNGPDNGGGGFDTIEYGSMFIHSKNIRQAFVRPPPISYAFNGGEIFTHFITSRL